MKRESPNPFGPTDSSELAAPHHGTYALVFNCSTPFQAVAGKLGAVFIPRGYWIYVGSAFGPGGLRSRLSHHLKPSQRPHWHLDYIKNGLRPVEIWTTTDTVKREHDWAGIFSTLSGASRPIEAFGASDCACRSHLIHLPRLPVFDHLKQQVRRVLPAHGPLFRLDLAHGAFDGLRLASTAAELNPFRCKCRGTRLPSQPKTINYGLLFESLDFTPACAYSAQRSTFSCNPLRNFPFHKRRHPMDDTVITIDDLNQEQTARLVMDVMHRTIIHYALWFTEIRHQMGLQKALEVLSVASEKSMGIQLNRLSKLLGFEMHNGIPKPLLNMPKKDLLALLDGAAINWLANDGVWFQSVEFTSGMNDAKRCNDSCWAHFSPFEAWAIKRFLGIGDRPGLEGLKNTLGFRVYARINAHSFADDGSGALVFRMNECRVQAARKSKNLPDYPCKSAGLVEYTYFARAIDPRIQTECIGCPPDDHPDDWCCAWRFSLK